jgi:GPH family glycoside/pentoside/hexuronide:cation symporter
METRDRADDGVRIHDNIVDHAQSQDQMMFWERVRYCLFNGADYLIKNIIGKYMFVFYTTTLGVPPIWIAIGQPVIKLLDVVTDPLVGEWSDRTQSKMGRRRPWILFGSIALGIVFPMSWMPGFVMFWEPTQSVVSVFIYFLIFKFLYYITHTVAVVPYYALGAELSTDYQERTRIVAWRHIIGLFGVVLATGSFWLATRDYLFPDEETGIAAVMVLVGLVIIVTGIISSVGTRERTQISFQKPMPIMDAIRITFSSKPFVFLVVTVLFYGIGQYFSVSFGAYLIIFILYDGDKSQFAELIFEATIVAVIVGVLLNLLIRRISERVEKVTLAKICLGLSLLVPVSVLFSFNPEYPYLYLIFHALALPIGNTMIEILPLSIVADICDLDEIKSGRRREGAYVGVYNSAFKSGYLLAPSLSMFLLAYTGFVAGETVQSPETLQLLRDCLLGGTALTFGLAFLCGLGIKLSRSEIVNAQAELGSRIGT